MTHTALRYQFVYLSKDANDERIKGIIGEIGFGRYPQEKIKKCK